ncbi:MAG: hypothetical protein AAF636_10880, partial [Pseudomonadota bacterium]
CDLDRFPLRSDCVIQVRYISYILAQPAPGQLLLLPLLLPVQLVLEVHLVIDQYGAGSLYLSENSAVLGDWRV